jgi:hypothetical protein
MRQKLQEVFADEVGQEALRGLDQVRELMTQSRLQILEKQSAGRKRTGKGATSDSPVPTQQLTPCSINPLTYCFGIVIAG